MRRRKIKKNLRLDDQGMDLGSRILICISIITVAAWIFLMLLQLWPVLSDCKIICAEIHDSFPYFTSRCSTEEYPNGRQQ